MAITWNTVAGGMSSGNQPNLIGWWFLTSPFDKNIKFAHFPKKSGVKNLKNIFELPPTQGMVNGIILQGWGMIKDIKP